MVINIREMNNAVIFDVEGEIRRSDIRETTLHQLVKSQLDIGKRNILFNFKEVEFIDSFGVGEILASFISIQHLGGKLKMAQISKKLELILKVTGLIPNVLEVHDTEESALGSFPSE